MPRDSEIQIGPEGDSHCHIIISPVEGDEHWLTGVLHIQAGCWRGAFRANFFRGELRTLARGLEVLHQHLTGSFDFETMEQHLRLHFEGDGRGHIRVRGKAQEDPVLGNAILLDILLDQTMLPPITAQLELADPA